MKKNHALTFVCITVFLDTVGFGIVMPVLPDLLIDLTDGNLSSTSSTAGYLIVTFALLNFLFAPVLGNLSDRYGRRPVLLISLFVYGLNYILMGLATSLWMLFLGRALTGITSSTYSTANALVADVSPPEERAQNFGLIGMAFGLGFIFGPTIGGLLGELDTRAPFFAAAIMAFLNTIYGFVILKETLPIANRRAFDLKRANPIGAFAQIGKFPVLIGLIVVMFIYNIGHHVYPSNWSFYTMLKFDWTPLDVGISMGVVGVLMAVVQGGLIRIVIPAFGNVKSAMFGFIAAATAYVGIALAPNSYWLYACCLFSAFSGFIGPAVTSIMSNQVPANQQGELQGINASVGSLAAIIGPLMLTQSFTYFTSDESAIYFPGAAFLIAALLTVVGIIVFWATKHIAIDAEDISQKNANKAQ